ncbi:hypothetical protein EUTSA_v10002946mg, partial [Eutrema salsugineum]
MSIFKRKSASNVFVRDLRPGSDNFVIKVNILKVWDGFKVRGGCSLEMVLVDQEDDRIQATVERFFAKSFRKDLVEGRSILINTFKVVDYNSEYRTTQTHFKIVFYATTTVSGCLNFPQEVPEKYMKSFPYILSTDLDNGYLIDVVGQIVRVGHVEDVMAQGKRRSRLKIYLRDESDLQLPCTLWADYAKEVADYVKRNCTSVVVVIIRLACIKNYRGEMSVSNAFNTTQILFDPVCPLVGKYVTLATIRSVANSNLWYYIACKKCEKSFFLLLNVDDGFGGMTVFVMFDKIAQKLFKKTAEEIFEESVGDNSSGLTQSLRDLKGKEFLFKVVVTEDNVKKVKTSFCVNLNAEAPIEKIVPASSRSD